MATSFGTFAQSTDLFGSFQPQNSYQTHPGFGGIQNALVGLETAVPNSNLSGNTQPQNSSQSFITLEQRITDLEGKSTASETKVNPQEQVIMTLQTQQVSQRRGLIGIENHMDSRGIQIRLRAFNTRTDLSARMSMWMKATNLLGKLPPRDAHIVLSDFFQVYGRMHYANMDTPEKLEFQKSCSSFTSVGTAIYELGLSQ